MIEDKKDNLLELLSFFNGTLADFCKRFGITDEEEIEEIWKMFRLQQSLN